MLFRSEELKFLKDIEKLIKREIPKVQVEGFTPSDKPEPEAPRSTQAHGRPPRGHGQGQQQRKPQGTNNSASNGQNASRNQGQQPRHNQNSTHNSAQNSAQNNASKPMSEAARHQAMPQTPLFAPKPQNRNPNNRNTNQGNTGRPNANTNNNSGSTHRSGGRGR